MSSQQMRVVGWIGLAAVVAFVAAFVLDPTPPTAGASGAAVLAHTASSSGVDRAAAFLFGLAAAGLVVFIAGVRHWFVTISLAPSWWGTSLLAGAVLAGSTLVVGSALLFTLVSVPPASLDLARFLNDAINDLFIFAGFGMLVTVGSLTALALATGGPLKMLGQLGVVVTVLQVPYLVTAFFSSGALVAGGAVSIVGFSAVGIFILVTAASMLVFARMMDAAAKG